MLLLLNYFKDHASSILAYSANGLLIRGHSVPLTTIAYFYCNCLTIAGFIIKNAGVLIRHLRAAADSINELQGKR